MSEHSMRVENLYRRPTNPLITAEQYYGSIQADRRGEGRTHTFLLNPLPTAGYRRFSMDPSLSQPRRFVIDVDSTLKNLLSREDTDNNFQITVEDAGPKVLMLGTAGSHGIRHHDIRGTYMLSNLLQELTLAQGFGRKEIVLDEARLNENPVDRLSRLIRTTFWQNLTRRLDASSVEEAGRDPKDWSEDPRPRIYIPPECHDQIEYYQAVAQNNPSLRLDVRILSPKDFTPQGIRDLNDAPGLLALAMSSGSLSSSNSGHPQGVPFVVPGGRFNEMYGWDSYMESIGLLLDERVDLVEGMVKNFCFSIKHYGKIFNANRTYYMGRSQPPFLTDMAFRVYDYKMQNDDGVSKEDVADLRDAIFASIKEYYGVWMAAPRLDPTTGLSRYRPEGIGVPPETESSHFTHVLQPFAKKYGMSVEAFVVAYNHERVTEHDLDKYFLHDRAVRESGHDTSYRLEMVAADLATIDLNALLYKYEIDIARAIELIFDDHLLVPREWCSKDMQCDTPEVSAVWYHRAEKRRQAVTQYLWNEEKGMFFDYDTMKKKQTSYESATTFWAMWSGLATPRQAAALVIKALPRFEEFGGLVSGTELSRGQISVNRPARQWDYPFGWAPQQMLAWHGMLRYGYEEEARRLAYKWLYMVTKAFVDFNGVVVEKYDVTRPNDPHKVEAEYGNQGSDFKGVAREGFGWVNASYQLGLSIVNHHMRRALATCTPWDTFAKATAPGRHFL